ncbi:DNA primase [candidate division KSB1 bacterium]|nr:DNA primase [candidate division KSB1 bacterium]
MAWGIPQDKIEEVRGATDIVDLISGYLSLKRRGKNYFGLCPFHQEKTPSFAVNPEKGIYHCFGCGAGGNVFSFLMEHEKISFPEAVRLLAQRSHIELPPERKPDEGSKENDILFPVNEMAAQFFQQELKKHPRVQAYLEGRGYSGEIVETFRIGYSPPGWDNLLNFAAKQGIKTRLLLRLGLAVQKEGSDRVYDRFRERLMFPILNLSGRVAGFGGRNLAEGEDIPKYLNSPESSIYQKGSLLYGLYHNRDGIRREEMALIVEGYTDLLCLVQYGIGNAVATLGTALTERQALLLKRYTSRVGLVFDADSAGAEAALRGGEVLVTQGLGVFVVTLPQGEDPDSFLVSKGEKAFRKRIEKPPPLLDFMIQTHKARGGLNDVHQKSETIRSMLSWIGRVRDGVKRNLILKELSEKVGLAEDVLASAMGKMRTRISLPEGVRGSPEAGVVFPPQHSAERDLVKVLIREEGLRKFIFRYIKVRDFQNPLLKEIARWILKEVKAGRAFTPVQLMDGMPAQGVSRFIAALESDPSFPAVEGRKLARDYIIKIKTARIEEQIEDVRQAIREAEQQGQDVSPLNRQFDELETLKKKIVSGSLFRD